VVRLRGSSDPDKVPDKIGAGGTDRRIVTADLWKIGSIETAAGRGPARNSRDLRVVQLEVFADELQDGGGNANYDKV
jgi:hypothetical protein